MKTSTKILLGGCLTLLVVGVVAIVAGILALNAFESGLSEELKGIEAEGSEYGRSNDQRACIQETIRRYKGLKLTDIDGGINASAFVDACLATAKPTEKFCDGVPSGWNVEESDNWKADQCGRAGAGPNDVGCRLAFRQKQSKCRPMF